MNAMRLNHLHLHVADLEMREPADAPAGVAVEEPGDVADQAALQA